MGVTWNKLQKKSMNVCSFSYMSNIIILKFGNLHLKQVKLSITSLYLILDPKIYCYQS